MVDITVSRIFLAKNPSVIPACVALLVTLIVEAACGSLYNNKSKCLNGCFRLFQLPQCGKSPIGFQDQQLDHLAQGTTSMQDYQLGSMCYSSPLSFKIKAYHLVNPSSCLGRLQVSDSEQHLYEFYV